MRWKRVKKWRYARVLIGDLTQFFRIKSRLRDSWHAHGRWDRYCTAVNELYDQSKRDCPSAVSDRVRGMSFSCPNRVVHIDSFTGLKLTLNLNPRRWSRLYSLKTHKFETRVNSMCSHLLTSFQSLLTSLLQACCEHFFCWQVVSDNLVATRQDNNIVTTCWQACWKPVVSTSCWQVVRF